MLNGMKNFLQFVNNNWTAIVILVSLIMTLVHKIRNYLSKSNTERIDIAKKQIKEVILKLISDAEKDYEAWENAGSIKRSQVIRKIFESYPALTKAVSQTALIQWMDDTIDEALNTLREIVAVNKEDKIESEIRIDAEIK